MLKLQKEQLSALAPLYKGSTDTMIYSVLQGKMGAAWADRLNSPRSAFLYLGGFGFPAGEPNVGLMDNLPVAFCIFTPPDEQWEQLAIQHKGEKHTRYAIQKEGDIFDRERLKRYIKALPPHTVLRQIDAELYRLSFQERWSEDFCCNFASEEDFLQNGIGYMALLDGRPVAGACSYSYYDGGIEIEIDTHPDYRRRGFALACAARLILTCLERGLYPSWDAHNPGSVALAQKLGYHAGESYSVYYFDKEADE